MKKFRYAQIFSKKNINHMEKLKRETSNLTWKFVVFCREM